MKTDASVLEPLKRRWTESWPGAKAVWSPFVKLQEPVWCLYTADARNEGLQGSFAMIRLTDHRIVIDLEEVFRSGVGEYAVEILAHEIGHHIYTPANLRDNAVTLGRIRWGLADIESRAPFVANIYEDMLINDKLHRFKGQNMAAVYAAVNKGLDYSEVWRLIMRSFEYLWRLSRGTLAGEPAFHTAKLDADASLLASLVRSYAKNWMDGAGRFAALLYPYLLEEETFQKSRGLLLRLLDAEAAGKAAGIISGLAILDAEAIAGAVDPRAECLSAEGKKGGQQGIATKEQGGAGPQQRYLSPGSYLDLQKQANPDADEQLLLNHYYKEIALPHLVRFRREEQPRESLTLPEGIDTWELGEPVEDIDWLETVTTSPQPVPGFDTRKRVYGPDTEEAKKNRPLDVYVGVDCSGSMGNPRVIFSWPVLAASIIGLSALRAGAKVMACLSGEPGSYMETDGFAENESKVLTVLTSYLGTGYAFGVPRLNKPFGKKRHRKSHAVVVTDDDLFSMLSADTKGGESNWTVIERALANAGGTGTIVLHSHPDWHRKEVKRLTAMGWRIFYVTNEEELLDFARNFAQANYQPAFR